MKRLVLSCILWLGRYAVLPVVALAGGLMFIWLLVLDDYARLALVTAPIMFCVIAAAGALALGILFVPVRRQKTNVLDEASAPALWRIWQELDPAFAKRKRTLRLDAEFNASIGETRALAGLVGRHVTMTVGVPLLMILDERAIRAVVAHEVAHAELQHITGGRNLLDFLHACENLLRYADPDRTITGRLAEALLRSLLTWLNSEYLALSRRNELAADSRAADRIGRIEMVRSLVLIAGGTKRLGDLVFDPLHTDLLGAISVPASPLQRISARLAEIRADDELAAATAAAVHDDKDDPDATHPPFSQRIANLGYDAIPAIDPIEAPAIGQLLLPAAARDLAVKLDADWRKTAEMWLRVGG
jgi:Zn-dependent protease with chaperone function